MAERKLTPKQQKFVDEYLTDLNATQAAIRAGYSKKTARSIAVELLTKPNIAAEIERQRKKTQEKLEISREKVIAELAAIAFANGTDYAKITSVEGQAAVAFTPTESLSPEKRKAIAGIKTTQSGIEVKTHDKLRAIELLGKYLGLFEQQKEVEEVSLADSIAAAYEKRKEKDNVK